MKTMWRLLRGGLIYLLVIGAVVWGALALWFAFPATDGLRAALALGFVATVPSVRLIVGARRSA